jgi:hypothetical protein
MNKIVISYFLILIIIFILVDKYLNEAPIIEKFYENEPHISLEELRVLTSYAHSFINGIPFKVSPNIIAPKFYIGNRLIDFQTMNEIQTLVNHPNEPFHVFEDKTKLEVVSVLGGIPNDIVVGNGGAITIPHNPLNFHFPTEVVRTPVQAL